MGEPDSIVFGDWLYGRSSVTFGYGVVLDYANAGGNLVVCPRTIPGRPAAPW